MTGTAFEDVPTGGTVTVSTAQSRRYLMKTATELKTVGFLAVDPGSAGESAAEFGHPSGDGRLPLNNGDRYLPSEALVLQPRNAAFTPSWVAHRKLR